MKTFVYLNYFHLQLLHIVGELNFSELVPALSRTIDLAERFDLAISNFGLRSVLQQLFAFDPPAVTFQHIKRIAFQYLVDYLMSGLKDELVKQSIDSASLQLQPVRRANERCRHILSLSLFQPIDEQILRNSDEYVSFPETLTPQREIVDNTSIKMGFFGQFALSLATLPHNYIDLLKSLSDGIADLLFAGSNRLEARPEVSADPLLHRCFTVSSRRRIKWDSFSYEQIKI